jgi:hypothetical protein
MASSLPGNSSPSVWGVFDMTWSPCVVSKQT